MIPFLVLFGSAGFVIAVMQAIRSTEWIACSPWVVYSFLCLLTAACLDDDKRKKQ